MATLNNSLGIQARDALQTAIRGITVANGYDAAIALKSNDVLVGNFVNPTGGKKNFPYVHIGNLMMDYTGQHYPSATDYPTITLDITGFVRDAKDRENRADLLGVAICKQAMVDYTFGGILWNSFYRSVEVYENTLNQGLGVVEIKWWAKAQHLIGHITG